MHYEKATASLLSSSLAGDRLGHLLLALDAASCLKPEAGWTQRSVRCTPSLSRCSEGPGWGRVGSRSRGHAFPWVWVVGCEPRGTCSPAQRVLREDTQGDFPTLPPRFS